MKEQPKKVISLEGNWKGLSIKSVVICQKRKMLFGSGKGSRKIFSYDLERQTIEGDP